MKFENKTKYKSLDEIIINVEYLLTNKKFHNELIKHGSFMCTSDSSLNGKFISDMIIYAMERNETISIKTYWYYNKNVVGKYVLSQPNNIYLNTRNLKYKINKESRHKEIVATIVHEFIHHIDSVIAGEYNFAHCGNSYAPWKENTAPYFCDFLAEKHCSYLVDVTYPTRNINETWVVKDKEFSFLSWLKSWWA